MKARKLFAGAQIRSFRQNKDLTQSAFAEQLGLSTSYLNQIENNQRPLSASVILALADIFDMNIAALAADESDRILADLREVLADPLFQSPNPQLQASQTHNAQTPNSGAPNSDASNAQSHNLPSQIPGAQEMKTAVLNTPHLVRALLSLYRTHKQSNERLTLLDDALTSEVHSLAALPYEEVRDFFHYADNYIDQLDHQGERFAQQLDLLNNNASEQLTQHLARHHDIRVIFAPRSEQINMLRSYDKKTRTLALNPANSTPTHSFQLAHQIGLLEQADLIEELIEAADFNSSEARAICRIGLANYFAGAVLMPYSAFINSAKAARHDLEHLSDQFHTSLEQTAHRLSTLQRQGNKGVPFFFCRVDQAGTITKRHSATHLQFARFGGACPLWNVHRAFETPDRIIRQLAETPDGVRYVSLARGLSKRDGGFKDPVRRYAIALGCEVKFADQLIYADDLDVGEATNFEPIGISCRICERATCHQRAVPPVHMAIKIDPNSRKLVPFELSSRTD